MSPSMTPTSQATSSSSSSAPPPVPPRPGSGAEAANVAAGAGGVYRPGYASAYGGAGMGMGYPYSTPSYGMMGSTYSPYASGGYGAYGSGYGYGAAAGAGAVDSPLIRLAEENSRPAFETIQAIVHTFGSVHMMFESTYLALHSSFRAVLGVVEHMTRMRAQLSHFLSAFAALRYIRWLYGRLRRLVTGREEETVGTDLDGAFASSSAAAGSPGDGGGGVNWPIVIYMGLVVAAPYLMWKLMASVVNLDRKRDSATKEEDASWLEGHGEHFEAVAEHDFRGQSDSELTFSSGQPLVLAPKHRQPRVRGWLLAGLKGQVPARKGLVPANHIKILGRRQGVGEAATTPSADRPDVVMNGSDGQEVDLEGAFK